MENKEKTIICSCKKELNLTTFKKTHFKDCKIFKNKFSEFDYKMVLLLKKYIINNEDLLLVRFLLTRYIKCIDKEINNYNNKKNSFKNNSETFPNYMTTKINEEEKGSINKIRILNKDNINSLNDNCLKEGNVVLNEDIKNKKNNIFDIFLKDDFNISNSLINNNGINKNKAVFNNRNEKYKNKCEDQIIKNSIKNNYIFSSMHPNMNIKEPFENEINNTDFTELEINHSKSFKSDLKINNKKINKFANRKIPKSVLERRKKYGKFSIEKLNEEDF